MFKLDGDAIWEMDMVDFIFWVKGIKVVGKYIGVTE
jgi:phage tail tube protein FII